MMLSGWGRYPVIDCATQILRNASNITQILEQSTSLIARGNGRAYGDAAINPQKTLLMKGCDRFYKFDTVTGLIECEAGVLLSDLLDLTMRHGWFPPVVPGTKYVTVGGLIAADVHGKNHHRDGSFGCYVESIRLAMADGTITICSRSQNTDIFDATLGGMGLTGIILSARIRLRHVASDMVDETVIKAASLDELLHLFIKYDDATYSVAWIDCLSGGAQSGRGVLMLGEHSEAENLQVGATRHVRRLLVPVELPISPINALSVRLFNELYYWLQKPRTRRMFYSKFFFPLDAIENWNRLYGRRGFLQYQCVIGGSESREALHRILRVVSKLGMGSFLAVLKKLGTGNRFLSFPMEGYTITLDLPVRRETMTGLATLDSIVSEHRGRIYLAKDARAPRNLIEQGYPDIEAFRRLRRKIDPDRKFRSALSERLAL